MPDEHVEYLIVGAGIAGSACAYHLTEDGSDPGSVLMLEEENPASKASSLAAGFLTPYQFLSTGNHPRANGYIREFYETLAGDPGNNLRLDHAPAFVFARSEEGVGNIEYQHRVTVEESQLLDPPELQSLIPALKTEGILKALHFEEGMYTDPYTATITILDRALDWGVELRKEEVLELVVEDGRVRGVETTSRSYRAGTVVLAAGAWSKNLARTAGLEIPLKPRLSQIAMVRPSEPVDFPLVNDPDLDLYYRSEHNDDVLIGGGIDKQEYDPETFQTHGREWFVQEVSEKAPQLSEGLAEATLVNSWAGLCSATPDRHPLIGETAVEGLYLCCGFNGEGIEHSPMAGRIVADLLLDREPYLDPDPYRPGRFRTVEDFEIKSAIEW